MAKAIIKRNNEKHGKQKPPEASSGGFMLALGQYQGWRRVNPGGQIAV